MKKYTLYILCGIPASGKSTWAQEQIQKYPNDTWVSRDNIRFSMVKSPKEYFSQEKKVYHMYIAEIQKAINAQKGNIYADATHINKASRMKLLRALNISKVNVKVIVFHTPLEICYERNENRKGLAFVSKSVIKRFSYQYTPPEEDGYEYAEVLHEGL